jgi:hypothetical protein
MRARLGKPTRRGYVIFGMLAISIVAIVVGVIIGGATGITIDAIAGGLLAFLLFVLFPEDMPRRLPEDPRDRFDDHPPGPGGRE